MYRIITTTLLILITSQSQANDCGANEQAQALAKLIMNDPLQQRPKLSCNSLLSQVAQQKAQEMAQRGIVSHMVGGSPNSRLRHAGYNLPNNYGIALANQVEALAGGYDSPLQVWTAFKKSDDHRSHLLAEHPFYQEQDELGVGYVYLWQSPHVTYWVVYVARNEDSAPSNYDDTKGIPNKSITGYMLNQPAKDN